MVVSYDKLLMLTHSSFYQAPNHRRDSILIVSDILSCATRGAGKCEIMYKVGLSSAQLNKYLVLLLKSELLIASNYDKKSLYKTSDKGKNFLETFETLAKLLD
jgi:predicted transcriptional regulator